MWWLLSRGNPKLLKIFAFSSLFSRRDHFYGDSFKQHFMSLSVFILLSRLYLQGDLRRNGNVMSCFAFGDDVASLSPSQILPMAGAELVSRQCWQEAVFDKLDHLKLCCVARDWGGKQLDPAFSFQPAAAEAGPCASPPRWWWSQPGAHPAPAHLQFLPPPLGTAAASHSYARTPWSSCFWNHVQDLSLPPWPLCSLVHCTSSESSKERNWLALRKFVILSPWLLKVSLWLCLFFQSHSWETVMWPWSQTVFELSSGSFFLHQLVPGNRCGWESGIDATEAGDMEIKANSHIFCIFWSTWAFLSLLFLSCNHFCPLNPFLGVSVNTELMMGSSNCTIAWCAIVRLSSSL